MDHHESHYRLHIAVWGQDGQNGLTGRLERLEAAVRSTADMLTKLKWVALGVVTTLAALQKGTVGGIISTILQRVFL